MNRSKRQGTGLQHGRGQGQLICSYVPLGMSPKRMKIFDCFKEANNIGGMGIQVMTAQNSRVLT